MAVTAATVRAVGTLELWESLSSVAPVVRGAAVLVARADASRLDAACDLPLARAAAAALDELRERAGAELATIFSCPDCGAVLEVPVSLADIRAATANDAVVERVGDVIVRSPTTSDLVRAMRAPDPATLREACIERPESGDRDDEDLERRIADAAERLAGAAAITARVVCPECGTASAADIDVIELLADHVSEQARVILADVAELAAFYGWSEADILAMSPARRHIYRDLARSVG